MEPSGWGHQIGTGMAVRLFTGELESLLERPPVGVWGVGAERPWLPPSLQVPACPRASQELMPAKSQLPWDLGEAASI